MSSFIVVLLPVLRRDAESLSKRKKTCIGSTHVINRDFVNKTIQCHGSCITAEGETYAQVIFYQEGFTYDAVTNNYDYNVTLVNNVDKADFFLLYLETIK